MTKIRTERHRELKFYISDWAMFISVGLLGVIVMIASHSSQKIQDELSRIMEIQRSSEEQFQKDPTVTVAFKRNAPSELAEREKKTSSTYQLTNFDPNKVQTSDLIDMGVPEKVARNWKGFIAAGGRFKDPEEIHKIYGMDETLLKRLLPFIVIRKEHTIETSQLETPIQTLNINEATAEEWQTFKGIGPVLSNRIVNFRNAVGGFKSIDQVAKTYGLPDSVFQYLRPKLFMDPPGISKVFINRNGEEALHEHPLINYKQARIIIRYRNEHGPFLNTDQLKLTHVLSDEVILALEPFLDFSLTEDKAETKTE